MTARRNLTEARVGIVDHVIVAEGGFDTLTSAIVEVHEEVAIGTVFYCQCTEFFLHNRIAELVQAVVEQGFNYPSIGCLKSNVRFNDQIWFLIRSDIISKVTTNVRKT